MDRTEQQAAGTHPAPCARHCEANAFQIEIRGLKAAHASAVEAGKKLAQQALKAERERDAQSGLIQSLRISLRASDEILVRLTMERDVLTAELKGVREQLATAMSDAGEFSHQSMKAQDELKALREQEPVVIYGGRRLTPENTKEMWGYLVSEYEPWDRSSLYAHPVPARELTDAIIGQIYIKAAAHIEHATQREIAFARAIERHLRGDAP